jgi:predicted DNA-binding WGR domain protein
MSAMHLTRIKPQANMKRYCRMQIVRGLFGDWGLMREWGRVGRSGQVRTDWFDSELEAKDARFELYMQKAKRGYD